jgi:ASC-1-like (ASCH) protein
MTEIIKKINKEMFDLIDSGKKKFEVRIEDDCKFNEGDVLVLKEHDEKKELTGREMRKIISFVLRTKECGWWDRNKIDEYGFTVLGLE